MYIEDVEDGSNTPKGCTCYACPRCQTCIALNALNTVQKIKAMLKMSSNTPKGCFMYVRASKMGKELDKYILAHNFLKLNGQSEKSFGKLRLKLSNNTIFMSKMWIKLRAVMLCMSKMSKIDQIH